MTANGTPRHVKRGRTVLRRAPFPVPDDPAGSRRGRAPRQPLTFGFERISEIEMGKNVPGVASAALPESQLLDGDPKR